MSLIGTFEFIAMHGEKLQPRSPVVELIVRPGVDGELYREDPAKARVFEKLTTAIVATLAAANTLALSYVAAKTQLLTVVDDQGASFAAVLVVDVQNIQVRQVTASTTPGANFVVTARWMLKPTV